MIVNVEDVEKLLVMIRKKLIEAAMRNMQRMTGKQNRPLHFAAPLFHSRDGSGKHSGGFRTE